MRAKKLFVLPALLLSSAQAPSPTPPSNAAPIIVEADANRDALVRNFVNALSDRVAGEKIARFEKPVCPMTFGLGNPLKGEVEQRLRTVARAAGLKVAAPGCAANVLLFVGTDKGPLIATLRKERPVLFGPMTAAQVQALATSPGGTASWHVTETRGADGRTLFNGGNSAEQPSMLTGVTSSRLLPQTRTDLDIAVVVLETAAISGATVTQLADYAAMRALTETGAAAGERVTVPTILTLIEDKRLQRPAPMSVTRYDLAYLKSLYAMPNTMQAAVQRGQLEQLMKRNLAAD